MILRLSLMFCMLLAYAVSICKTRATTVRVVGRNHVLTTQPCIFVRCGRVVWCRYRVRLIPYRVTYSRSVESTSAELRRPFEILVVLAQLLFENHGRAYHRKTCFCYVFSSIRASEPVLLGNCASRGYRKCHRRAEELFFLRYRPRGGESLSHDCQRTSPCNYVEFSHKTM